MDSYRFTRWVFLRLLGLVYFFAFGSLWVQIRGLLGSRGILPAATFLNAISLYTGPERYWLVPTLAWLNSGDTFLSSLCAVGMLASLLLIAGILPIPVLTLLYLLYLSLVNIGQDFLSFQWDALLLETGFLAIFFAPWQILPRYADEAPPPRLVLFLLRWLLFRLMFLSGVVKLASGDVSWRGLTALSYHYTTQPLPTPLAWYLYQLPLWFHKLSTASALSIELAAPFLIFAPRRWRLIGAGLLIGLQLSILLTGNYAFFNLLTIALCLLLFDDAFFRHLVPARLRPAELAGRPEPAPANRRSIRLLAPLAVVILGASAIQMGEALLPEAGVFQTAEPLLRVLEPFHIVNSYGLFAVMTTTRPEIVVEGSNDGKTWQAYDFPYKPGDIHRAPGWVAPYQPRLDWQMWFAALSSDPRSSPWFGNFVVRLLQGSPDVLALLKTNPFGKTPPHYVRAMLYNYRFTDAASARVEHAWWQRTEEGVYFPPASLRQ